MNNNQLKILNYLATIGIFISIFQLLLFTLYLPNVWMAWICALIMSVFTIVLALNKLNNHSIAKNIYCIFTIPAISCLDWLVDHQIGIHLYYIPLSIVIFMIYDVINDKKTIVILMIWTLFTYGLFDLYLPNQNVFSIPTESIKLLYNINVVCCITITIISSYHFMKLIKLSELNLLDTKARLRDVFENSHASIFYLDLNYNLQLFNSKAAEEVKKILGVNLEINHPILEMLPEASRSDFKEKLEIAFSGKSLKYQKEILNGNNDIHYYEITFSPVYNQNKIIGVTTIGLDNTTKINNERELKQRAILHQTLFDGSPDSLFLIDASSKKIISLNSSAQKKFGLNDDFIQLNYNVLFDENIKQSYWDKVENYLVINEIWSQEIGCKTTMNTIFLGEVFIKQFNLFDQPHYIIRITDLSKKEIERDNQLEFLKLKKQVSKEKARQENLKLIIHGQEIERQRISQELHDGLGQILTATRLQIAALKFKDQENFYQDKKNIKLLIDKVIAEIKFISNNLMPTGITDLGLIDALENTFSLFPKNVNIIFDYTYTVKNIPLTNIQNISLFRIIQEAVNNAIKHANANKIFVCIGVEKNELFVEIYDHGKGFLVDDVKKSKQLTNGLTNMKERASIINATLEIESEVNRGTKISVTLKLN